jgi:glyoxylase-like metal-dependent hydrolase (beta-lactamase superfamily II)
MSELDSPVPGVRVLRQDNAGPMTLEGTQSYVLQAPSGAVVIDPGDDDAAHQEALAALGPVALILVTHRHHDHVGGLARLRGLTGAASRGAAEGFSVGAAPLLDGETLALGDGAHLRVLATPGHTSDSISLVLSRDGVDQAVFTGDTILGHGTTIIDHPDGTLGDYLDSLEALRALGPVPTLPAHGGFPGPVDAVAREYLSHRLMRLEQVKGAADGLRERGLDPTVGAVTDIVYAEVDPSVRGAAEHTVSAQLALLARRGQI